MYAIVRTGGKQYRVSPEDLVDVERIEGEPGDRVDLQDVLLVADGSDVKAGRPVLEGARVVGQIVEQFRGRKILVFKMKRRKDYRRLRGHRQELTRLKILEIEG